MKDLVSVVILSVLVNGLFPEERTKEKVGMITGLCVMIHVMRALARVFLMI